MKYLDEPRLAYWSNFLRSVELGDRLLSVRTDAFSCKKAGDDKRLSKELERQLSASLPTPSRSSSAPSAASAAAVTPTTTTPAAGGFTAGGGGGGAAAGAAFGTSPSFGVLTDVGVRRTLVDLICTMNASFPDYDFSGVRPDSFDKEASVSLVRNKVNAALAEVSVIHNKIFLESFWADLDEVMTLKDCEVYSYSPDMEGDPFTEGCLWSFNHFFLNKNLKRVLFLHCTTKSKLHVMEDMLGSDSDADDDDEEEEQDDADMDQENDNDTCPGYIMGDMDMEPAGGDDDSLG
ncbi:conserved unknown protein [Ectocarpus siliculosus]|uniref:Repressor of RNA polymerase III transcription n=1 Tax=Ectocarpus siliculosus TaxID=2880 RepID=D7FXY4_ECTSI|nr:conserved unknown protein [Ectocarpus siliculosus]|eukprot:CBJ32397.1 conserved unknown protein [Ectocarpus siliculosus]